MTLPCVFLVDHGLQNQKRHITELSIHFLKNKWKKHAKKMFTRVSQVNCSLLEITMLRMYVATLTRWKISSKVSVPRTVSSDSLWPRKCQKMFKNFSITNDYLHSLMVKSICSKILRIATSCCAKESTSKGLPVSPYSTLWVKHLTRKNKTEMERNRMDKQRQSTHQPASLWNCYWSQFKITLLCLLK
jgi:hypothetical protein